MNTISSDVAKIKTRAEQTVDTVANVDKIIDFYGTMVSGIDKIASNIHMISLNASIEAARAGEHGRPFAVVAEAIRTLAGETQATTSKISKATAEARTALGSISGMVLSINEDIAKAHKDVNEIAESANALLKEE
jgi:methyl-accepting chemotaxis protein